jgi:uncharacterized membrane protein
MPFHIKDVKKSDLRKGGALVLGSIIGLVLLSLGIYFLVRSTTTDEEAKKSKELGVPLVIFGGIIATFGITTIIVMSVVWGDTSGL